MRAWGPRPPAPAKSRNATCLLAVANVRSPLIAVARVRRSLALAQVVRIGIRTTRPLPPSQ